MTGKHVLSLAQLGPETLAHLTGRSVEFGHDNTGLKPLEGKTVGLYFRKPSTRTRTSFTTGALKLGATTIAFGPSDLQLTTGETLQDTGRVLSGYIDALVVRTNDPQGEMEALAEQDEMPVINAMSAEEHPTQAIADLSTLREAFGSLDGIHMLYLGEGNNTASALAFAFGQTPNTRLTIVTPENYGLPLSLMARAQAVAEANGSFLEQHHDMEALPTNVDAVYTTRWHTMGVPKADPDWREKFLPYSVSSEVMSRVSKPEGTIFMHDLPAVRGDDVCDEVLDGPQSHAWRQARYKMFSAMAVLEWCLS